MVFNTCVGVNEVWRVSITLVGRSLYPATLKSTKNQGTFDCILHNFLSIIHWPVSDTTNEFPTEFHLSPHAGLIPQWKGLSRTRPTPMWKVNMDAVDLTTHESSYSVKPI